jgi:hypothetical protein
MTRKLSGKPYGANSCANHLALRLRILRNDVLLVVLSFFNPISSLSNGLHRQPACTSPNTDITSLMNPPPLLHLDGTSSDPVGVGSLDSRFMRDVTPWVYNPWAWIEPASLRRLDFPQPLPHRHHVKRTIQGILQSGRCRQGQQGQDGVHVPRQVWVASQ